MNPSYQTLFSDRVGHELLPSSQSSFGILAVALLSTGYGFVSLLSGKYSNSNAADSLKSKRVQKGIESSPREAQELAT
ncbi:hypothetical protein Fmac_031708 [Flemingia macrophylla]|uniref:Uncharacterized protein n=1 Tax=Flemingia macrophylla TaxID=520843 RepID=A0ABD1L2U2_9FABA